MALISLSNLQSQDICSLQEVGAEEASTTLGGINWDPIVQTAAEGLLNAAFPKPAPPAPPPTPLQTALSYAQGPTLPDLVALGQGLAQQGVQTYAATGGR